MTQTSPSAWRYFPHAMIAALGLMVAVDGGLGYIAINSFPGKAATDVFDHSNSYDEVLAVAEREAKLGWTMKPAVQDATPVLDLTDRDGVPLQGAKITAVAERPLGAPFTTTLKFDEGPAGHYVSDSKLVLPGQWDLKLEVLASKDGLHATRRVLVK